MNEFVDFLLSNSGAAFAIALIIFIITVWLVIKRMIGFVVTIILLVFALISGFFVANADLVREILKGLTGRNTPKEQETLEQLKNQIYKSYEEIRNEFSQQKEEFNKILHQSKEAEADEEVVPDSQIDNILQPTLPASPASKKTKETAPAKKSAVNGK